MKKSNSVIYILAVLVSAFLLWLWYHLGFNHVDAPLDLVLSIIWWVLVAGVCVAINRVEKKRQERTRTCFVAANHVFNSEAGTATARSPQEAVERIHDILANLEYGMGIADMPKDAQGNPVKYDYVVRSRVFDLKRRQDPEAGTPEELDWEGEVAVCAAPDADPVPFTGRDGLLHLLQTL